MHGTAVKTTLAEIIVTDELDARPPGRHDPASENSALRSIAASMVDRPARVLSQFVELAVRLAGGVAGGLSLYEPKPRPGVFRWHYLLGPLKRFDGATTPLDFPRATIPSIVRGRRRLSSHPGTGSRPVSAYFISYYDALGTAT